MGWEVKEFYTNQDGTLSGAETTIDIVQKGIKIEETVGDEFYLKAGDLRLVTDKNWTVGGLTYPLAGYWVSVYKDGGLVGVFSIMHRDREENYKYGELNIYRLRSLQSVFYEDLAAAKTFFSSTSSDWNAALTAGVLNINELRIKDAYYNNRYGFSLGDILSSLSGRHDQKGYQIDTISHPIPTMTATVPTILRGISKDTGTDTIDAAIDFNFYWNGTEYWGMTWKDIFEIASFGWNAFVLVRPKITSNKLSVDIEIIPKINVTVGSTVSVKWEKLKKEWYKHNIAGVKINIINDEYTQGNSEAANVFTRSLNVANPIYDVPAGLDWLKTLYWFDSGYRSATVNGYPDYDQLAAYFDTGKVEPYYNDMITAGHGYSGRCVYEGQKVLDQVSHNGDTFQITRITVNDKNIANIEGVVIS